ncbi:helix-turn-helix domain-containing protein [Pararoseomonas sp. SCSIO 73927]|uniref:helix-turn-helix transcriptional regulator n=1 Tax=Pararoseomonas sp. SCSIO 73927 TaxID=3114537 RepID=UPI0030D2F0AB
MFNNVRRDRMTIRTSDTPPPAPLTHRIDQVVRMTGIGRTKVYEALKKGELEAVKFGRSTLVLDASVRAWIGKLPNYSA